MKNKTNTAYLQLHIAVFFWGFTGVLGRAISINASAIVYYRMFFTAVIIGVILSYRRIWHRISWQGIKKIYFIGFLFAIHWVAFYWSIKMAGASIALVCLSTGSVFTALLYPFFSKEKINVKEIFFGFIALAGVMIMYLFQNGNNDSTQFQSDQIQLGIILAISAALISAIFTILNKPLAALYEPRNIVFHEMTAGFLFLSLLIPFYMPSVEYSELIPQGWDYIWMFCLVYFCTVLGQSLAMKSLNILSPFIVTLSVNLEPIYGVILAFIFYKENQFLGWSFYVGLALIMLSLLLQSISSLQAKKARNKAIQS